MKKFRIFSVLVLTLLIFSTFFIILAAHNTKHYIGTIQKSQVSVNLNDFSIPTYNFEDKIYIVADNLELFGIDIEFDKDTNALNIKSTKDYYVVSNNLAELFIRLNDGDKIESSDYKTYIEGTEVTAYTVGKYTLIPLNALEAFCAINPTGQNSYSLTLGDFTKVSPSSNEKNSENKIVVLDPGHGKSSSKMTDEEKLLFGWVKNDNGSFGEWRHYKSGQSLSDCHGSDCNGRTPANGSCWYPIENSDRETEPQINLNNVLSAKAYLEEMGYEVRLTRNSNDENPSISKRLSYCYPDNDISSAPDALMFVCIHSNAGNGSGSSYIELSGKYDQPHIGNDYVIAGNTLGKYINEQIGKNTLLKENPPITNLSALIAFCKSPVICAYMEIGFYDNQSDLAILNESSDAIGKSIAEGIDKFLNEYY